VLEKISSKIGLVGIAVALLAVAYSAALPFLGSDRLRPMLARPELAQIRTFKYKATDLARFKQYSGDLDRAIAAKGKGLGAGSLKIFGYREDKILAGVNEIPAVHQLSMVYESEGNRYAVIDNRLYKQGDRLADGVLISDVNMGGAVIIKDGEATLLTLENKVTDPISSVPLRRTKRTPVMLDGESDYNAIRAQRLLRDIQQSLKVLPGA